MKIAEKRGKKSIEIDRRLSEEEKKKQKKVCQKLVLEYV